MARCAGGDGVEVKVTKVSMRIKPYRKIILKS